ncbi:MAG: SRPBCC family protein [Gammaproteobacteria bacterium]
MNSPIAEPVNWQPETLDKLLVDNVSGGQFEVSRDIYRDPELFELELKHVFESSWVFLAHETQIPEPHDYLNIHIGRQPVIVMRDQAGDLRAFLNTCPHKGALVCQNESGNKKFHVCPYHGWTFDSAGNNILVKDEAQGHYGQNFHNRGHGLEQVARLESYRGFLFGSLNADVEPLRDYLDGIHVFLDMIVDQSAEGAEVIPGRSYYTFDANWKMQLENCVDAYHLTSTHPSFMTITASRAAGGSEFRNIDIAEFVSADTAAGNYTFRNGHNAIWIDGPPEVKPLYAQYDELCERVGKVKADLMMKTVNFTVFPNLQFSVNACIQMRVMKPLQVNKTEMRSFCVGPKGEAKAQRQQRIHQFEDFFNPTGLATPDDSRVYESVQNGLGARSAATAGQGHDRGISNVIDGPDEYARQLQINPVTSSSGTSELQDETVFHASYRELIRRMRDGVEKESSHAK